MFDRVGWNRHALCAACVVFLEHLAPQNGALTRDGDHAIDSEGNRGWRRRTCVGRRLGVQYSRADQRGSNSGKRSSHASRYPAGVASVHHRSGDAAYHSANVKRGSARLALPRRLHGNRLTAWPGSAPVRPGPAPRRASGRPMPDDSPRESSQTSLATSARLPVRGQCRRPRSSHPGSAYAA